MTTVAHDGTNLYCSCCDNKKMGEIRPEGLLIRERKGDGQHHIAAVPIRELLERITGTLNGSAIIERVAQVVGTR